MRAPLPQPITLDFDQVWLIKTPRGRALLDVLSSGEIAALLARKVDLTDARLSDARAPTVHGNALHDSTVCASDDPRLDWNRILTDGSSVLVGFGNVLWGL